MFSPKIFYLIDDSLSDIEVPSLSFEAFQRFPTDPGKNTAVVVYHTPVATDNSGDDVTAVCTPALGSVLPMGPTDVVCEATDGSGNKATCVFQVIIEGKYHFSLLCSTETEVAIELFQYNKLCNFRLHNIA